MKIANLFLSTASSSKYSRYLTSWLTPSRRSDHLPQSMNGCSLHESEGLHTGGCQYTTDCQRWLLAAVGVVCAEYTTVYTTIPYLHNHLLYYCIREAYCDSCSVCTDQLIRTAVCMLHWDIQYGMCLKYLAHCLSHQPCMAKF